MCGFSRSSEKRGPRKRYVNTESGGISAKEGGRLMGRYLPALPVGRHGNRYYVPSNKSKTIPSVQGRPLARWINMALVSIGHPQDQFLTKWPARDLYADGKACPRQSHGHRN